MKQCSILPLATESIKYWRNWPGHPPTAAAEPGSPELEGDSLRTQKPTHRQHGPWAHLDEQEPGPLLPISNPFQSGALYTDAQLIHFSHSFAFICYISLDFLFL